MIAPVPATIDEARCAKPGCRVSSTGACEEGRDPKSCPHYTDATAKDTEDKELDSDPSDEEAQETPEKGDHVKLPSGEALDVAGVDEFLRWRPMTLVTIVGDRDSGKTTLISSIYDRFLRGPFAGYLFAGSRTLIGLERRSHYARVDSGMTTPDTPRTSISEGVRFFHLALARADAPDARADLMLSDRAGETYRQARGNSRLVSDLIEVKKADCLVLLLDGARVVNPVERAGAVQSVRQTLRALWDGGALDAGARVQVATTKIDILRAQPEGDKAHTDTLLTALRDGLRADFGPRLGDLSFWDIAARDPAGTFEPAYGVDALLASWLDKVPRPATIIDRPGLVLQSEFDRLLARTPMETLP